MLYSCNLPDTAYWKPVRSTKADLYCEHARKEYCKKYPFYGHGNMICLSIENFWKKDIYKVNDVFPLLMSEIEFEGQKYNVWNDYMTYLENTYGDIWILPGKVQPHHLDELGDGINNALAELHQKNII